MDKEATVQYANSTKYPGKNWNVAVLARGSRCGSAMIRNYHGLLRMELWELAARSCGTEPVFLNFKFLNS